MKLSIQALLAYKMSKYLTYIRLKIKAKLSEPKSIPNSFFHVTCNNTSTTMGEKKDYRSVNDSSKESIFK